MKLYHIIGWADTNPVIIANSPKEAGEKYIEKYGLGFRLLDEADTSAAFIEEDAVITAQENTPEYFDQLGDAMIFHAEEVCVFRDPCVECAAHYEENLPISIEEDVDFLAALLHVVSPDTLAEAAKYLETQPRSKDRWKSRHGRSTL